MRHQTVVVLDFGSQYTQLVARRIREAGVYCEIRPCTDRAPDVVDDAVIGVVLSGGPASVLGDDAPPFDARWLGFGVPVLGVCYGMQLLAHLGGGTVARGQAREYGKADVVVGDRPGPLFDAGATTTVWMSHGDHVAVVPPGFRVVATSGGAVAAMASADDRTVGLQFHPEVTHSVDGAALIGRFLDVCGATRDWSARSFVAETVARLRDQIGDDEVICGLSGGVDSSVVAALLHRAIGRRVHCIFVDTGLSREGEVASIAAEFADFDVRVVDSRAEFLAALAGVEDPERKRKIIGERFVRVFEAEAKKLDRAKWLAQGTLYPDVIESVSVRGPSATIKSHHNVGGLPKDLGLGLVEPLRELFKDEARAVGLELGLSEARVYRQPFPGPGLAVRCLGALTAGRLDVLRRADAVVRDEIERAGWDRRVWQAFAVLLPVRSVGVQGDERTYDETCAVRAVTSTDGMTADWAPLPHDLLARISGRITNEVRGVNRVVYDISSKPPATIEWE